MTKTNSSPVCRDALLEAASVLFVKKGYQDVSTREIAEAAGVNLGLIQYYFGSKSKLFMETVHRMMAANPCLKAGLIAQNCPECPVVCTEKLCEFIYAYLEYLLRPTVPQPCKLLYRELHNETANDQELCAALVEAVSGEFMKPVQATLCDLIKAILQEEDSTRTERRAFSVLGQCSFYLMHRPVVEKMWGCDISQSPLLEEIGAHISRFTLQSLGVSSENISRAIESVFRIGTQKTSESLRKEAL